MNKYFFLIYLKTYQIISLSRKPLLLSPFTSFTYIHNTTQKLQSVNDLLIMCSTSLLIEYHMWAGPCLHQSRLLQYSFVE